MSAAVVLPPVTVQCNYCGEDAELVDKREIYWQGAGGKVWLCRACKAWIPAHRDKLNRPMGTLAKAELRAKRLKAHCLFDDLWRGVGKQKKWTDEHARKAGYCWLAAQMGISPAKCQIGFFGHVETQRVIDICSAVLSKKEAA